MHLVLMKQLVIVIQSKQVNYLHIDNILQYTGLTNFIKNRRLVKMNKKTVENKNKVEYKVTNKIYNDIVIKFITELPECMWNVEEVDKLFEKAHNKPQLNTLEKNLKVRLVTLYLNIPFEKKIKSVYNEKIHRLKWENSSKWDKDNKCFIDDELQEELQELKNTKVNLLSECSTLTSNCLEKIKKPILFQTYEFYCKLQAHKNKSDYEDYKKLYKVAIAQYLSWSILSGIA